MNRRVSRVLAVVATLLVGLSGCADTSTTGKGSSPTRSAAATVVTDMAGRKVTVPATVDKVYPTSPVAQLLVYTFDPDRLLGWNYVLSEKEKKYIDPKYQKLPVLGGSFGGKNTMNTEEIIKRKPGLIIDAGEVNAKTKKNADDLQQRTGIPVFVLGSRLDSLADAYTQLGKVLNNGTRAQKLSSAVSRLLGEAKARSASIPDSRKVSVYYAEDLDGLSTDPSGSPHSRVLDVVGAKNVANVPMKPVYGRTAVDFEQVLTWNPDVVVICPEPQNAASLWDDPAADRNFKKLPAVKKQKYLRVPYGPFNWFDRPPSVNQVLGIVWAAESLYPESYDFDLVKETRTFYADFYHYTLSDDQAKQILEASNTPAVN